MTTIEKCFRAVADMLTSNGVKVAPLGATVEPRAEILPIAYLAPASGEATYSPAGDGYEIVSWDFTLIAVGTSYNNNIIDKIALSDHVLYSLFPQGSDILMYGTEIVGVIRSPARVRVVNDTDVNLRSLARDMVAVEVDFTVSFMGRQITR